MNEYCDLSPAERELLALVRGREPFSLTVSLMNGVSTVKKAAVNASTFSECQAASFDAAWYCVHQESDVPGLRVIKGGRANG